MKSLFRTALVPLLLRRWRQERGDPAELIRRFGLPEDAEKALNVSLELDRLSDCADFFAAEFRDPHLGLHAAETLPRGYYGLIEFVVRSAPTLEDGIRAFCRYERLINEALRFSLSTEGNVAVLEWTGGHLRDLNRHAAEYTLSAIIRLGRRLIRVPWMMTQAWFASPAPPELRELAGFFGTERIQFKRDSIGVSFDAAVLASPISTTDPQLQAVLQSQADQELQKRPAGDDFEGQVRAAIQESFRGEGPLLAATAKRLHITPRTLQRRLGEGGLSFQELVDQIRKTLAIAYLENPNTGIADVAFRLGYTSHAAFTRAFKEWTGKAPADYRRQR